jgi:hypothetical protein
MSLKEKLVFALSQRPAFDLGFLLFSSVRIHADDLVDPISSTTEQRRSQDNVDQEVLLPTFEAIRFVDLAPGEGLRQRAGQNENSDACADHRDRKKCRPWNQTVSLSPGASIGDISCIAHLSQPT